MTGQAAQRAYLQAGDMAQRVVGKSSYQASLIAWINAWLLTVVPSTEAPQHVCAQCDTHAIQIEQQYKDTKKENKFEKKFITLLYLSDCSLIWLDYSVSGKICL